jgi:bifunctional DNase/RNase
MSSIYMSCLKNNDVINVAVMSSAFLRLDINIDDMCISDMTSTFMTSLFFRHDIYIYDMCISDMTSALII